MLNRGQIKIWFAPSPNPIPAKSWKSIYWRTSLIVDLSLCRRKSSLEGSGVEDLLDHLACLWLMRLESQGIFARLHQDKLNKGTDRNLIFPLSQSWKSNTGEYSLINDLSLCRRKTSPEGSGVVDLLDHLTCLWLMRSESQGIFTWLHQDELNKRGQIKIWSTPHPNVFFKKLKKLNTRAYPLIVDMVYCRRKMYLMASGHVFVDILDLFRLCEHWKGKQKPLWDAQLWD